MYSVENPAFSKPLGTLESLIYGPRFTGVGAQILGADDKYICQYSPESKNFWGSKFHHSLPLFLFSSAVFSSLLQTVTIRDTIKSSIPKTGISVGSQM